MFYRPVSSGGGLFKLILALLLAYFVYKYAVNYLNDYKINSIPPPAKTVATETIKQINKSITPTYSKPTSRKENKPKTPKEIQEAQGVPIEYMVRPQVANITDYYPDADPETLKPENYK